MSNGQRYVFDQIAPGWYHFRHHSIFSSELSSLAKRWQKGKLLNLGCGHGADFISFKDSFELYGLDFSKGMVDMAAKYADKYNFKASITIADITELPYPDDSFDWAISVATYHHLDNASSRIRAFQELYRVLRKNGEAFITVWNRYQPRFWFSNKDVRVPWRKKDKVLYRYYHLFSYSEIERLAKKAGFKILSSSPESRFRLPFKLFSRNICLLLKK